MVTVMPYERYVHYRRGKLQGILEPGRHRFWSTGHRLVRVDTRVQIFDVRPQEVPTSDGITVKVSASARLQVTDPVAFIEFTADPHGLVYDAIKSWLRSVVHLRTLDEVIAGIVVDETPHEVLEAAGSAGFSITDFAVRDVLVPGDIRRATEELVTTRQQSQIALEQARSDVAVLRALANSAKILEDHPVLASLRLAETASTHGGTVIIERPAT
ncbi:SPFH domain-containing protein [Aeromicrobium sp.]|uniref:SPFH domain-containing protein n=1 Tax=Aeromicrobium sp. TaxID=1871063 RepID=UPI002FC8D273